MNAAWVYLGRDAKSIDVVAFVQRIVGMCMGTSRIRWDVRFFTIGTCFFAATILIEVSITGLKIDDERRSVP